MYMQEEEAAVGDNCVFFFNDTATTEIYTLSLHDALPICVREDDATAVMWFTKVAEQGKADAQFNLGVMYDNGMGVPEDDVIAYMWLDLAAAQGNENAKVTKDIITKTMTEIGRAHV